jgi:hypothetical protein
MVQLKMIVQNVRLKTIELALVAPAYVRLVFMMTELTMHAKPVIIRVKTALVV